VAARWVAAACLGATALLVPFVGLISRLCVGSGHRTGRLQRLFAGRLLFGVLAGCALFALSALLALPLYGYVPGPPLLPLHGGRAAGGGYAGVQSSINFCEADFTSSAWVAEPMNSVTSLTTFGTLGAFGLAGPGAGNGLRFALAYGGLVVIGLGSAALHSTLLATAQAGDELPMLWLSAAFVYIAGDDFCDGHPRVPRACLGLVPLTSALATYAYTVGRSNFAVFFVIFLTYVVLIILYFIAYNMRAAAGQEQKFRQEVVAPLSVASGCLWVLGGLAWAAEMLLCQDYGSRALWQYVLHPVWHLGAGFASFLLLQLLVAMWGQRRGQQPRLDWCGVPFVVLTH